MRITFFKTGKAKQFNYVPRYYDEQKEEFEKRKKRIEQELGVDEAPEGYRSRLLEGAMTDRLLSKRKSNRGSTLRMIAIVLILGVLAMYLLRDVDSLMNIF